MSAPVAVTLGDPAGVGPELLAALWRSGLCTDMLAIGSAAAIAGALPDTPLHIVATPSDFTERPADHLSVWDCQAAAPITAGLPDTANAASVVQSLQTAARLALAGDVRAIVTLPIHKAGLYAAGFDAPGHTEFFARAAGLADQDAVMMLTTEGLRVVPLTVHIGLGDVVQTLSTELIIHKALITHHDLRKRFGIDTPRLAIAALNPHAGEDGMIGGEEATHIQPALWALGAQGIDVSGPHPADTLFHPEARKTYDAVLCMYHDQALIPLKMLDFWGGVNVTLGLPFIRTSPDHGTAFDIAGKGLARADSALAALRLANRLSGMQGQP